MKTPPVKETVQKIKKNLMRKTGAKLAVHALEQLPVTHTFGIPGVHVTELYDELGKSEKLHPVLVTHECGAAFMADAMSRTSDSIGVLVIVPAAGVTHALSGIGEAFLDGIPMLIISGGVQVNVDFEYQLHQLDMHGLLSGITKKTYRITRHRDIVPTIFEAHHEAVSGEPGPVFVEIPANVLLSMAPVDDPSHIQPVPVKRPPLEAADSAAIREAAEMLSNAASPGLFLGWGCRDCEDLTTQISDLLNAPVSTTLQGLSVFPGNHPLHTGMGFSRAAVPAAENAFKDCDCLLAVGVRFSEIPTGSYGVNVPENLIHIDINPSVFHKNYPAKVTVVSDARVAMEALLEDLKKQSPVSKETNIQDQIQADKKAYLEEWKAHVNDRVNPALFFESLRRHLDDDAIIVADDGNHTFLCAELLTTLKSKHFICPTDFNCMGYCVPGVIGAKLANPGKQVAGIVGDGAFLMTCMEIITASAENLGVIYFVFHDGELSMIAQGQEIPYNRKTCTILGTLQVEGVAKATGAAYLEMGSNEEIDAVMGKALSLSEKDQPVIVDVKIDYSKRTRFTKGAVKSVLGRFPLGDKVRFIGRAMKRKVTG